MEDLENDRGSIFREHSRSSALAPAAPAASRGGRTKLVDEIAQLLEDPELSPWQADDVERTFVFGE